MSGITSFIQAIWISGAFLGSAEGTMIALTWRAARKKSEVKPEYALPGDLHLGYIVISVFLFGASYTALHLLGII